MKRFIEGDNRDQKTLLPDCLEDFVSEDNPVRVVDVFIDGLNFEQLGFDGVLPAATGRPGYHPAIPVAKKQRQRKGGKEKDTHKKC
ncbi:MAG: transposase [Gammaproteobacteria bacterium]|jgi:transposase